MTETDVRATLDRMTKEELSLMRELQPKERLTMLNLFFEFKTARLVVDRPNGSRALGALGRSA